MHPPSPPHDHPAPPDLASFRPVGPAGLPIFRADRPTYTIFSTPGWLVTTARALADTLEAELQLLPPDPPPIPSGAPGPPACPARSAGLALARRAAVVLEDQQARRAAPFDPACLTVYLHRRCALRCTYCFADATPTTAGALDLATVRAAAALVAERCAARGLPLTVVLHGGGEPTLDLDLAEMVLAAAEQAAAAHGLPVFRYLATGGAIAPAAVDWLARRIDLVGISCDGPPDVQDRQRPLATGGGTSRQVERTGRALRAAGRPVHVRVTLTRETLERQVEIVEYVAATFAPQEIHVEPVYAGGRAGPTAGFVPADAVACVAHFLSARRRARELGTRLVYAGARLDALHGPYCNVFRDVVQVVPGGAAVGCFKLADSADARARGLVVGGPDGAGRFVLERARIDRLRDVLAGRPDRCADCFARFHCAGDCPERCPLDPPAAGPPDTPGDTFRCRLQRTLAAALIDERAAEVWGDAAHAAGPAAATAREGGVYAAAIG